jgi:tRNA1Val (adenine37-N6)-methyltransferase
MELREDERIDDLEYKGLKIIQNCNGFCFGVDSVLLSDFAREIKENSEVVDIGTGTGIVSILLTSKTKLKSIYGVEIQEDVAEMASRSSKLNHLEDKFRVINANIKDIFDYLEPYKFDAIVTNPPYKKENTGVKNLDKRQLISRHEVECNLEDIITASYKLLKDLGEFYMVHRAERLVDIMVLLRKHKMEPKRIRFVHSKAGDKPTLILVKAIKGAREYLKIDKPLVIYKDNGEYTDEVLEIYDKKRK